MPRILAGQGADQLAEVIHKIKTNPNDRRIIMSAWNPAGAHMRMKVGTASTSTIYTQNKWGGAKRHTLDAPVRELKAAAMQWDAPLQRMRMRMR